MTRLAHSQNIAKGVCTTGGKPMDFPFTPQHRITPARVVRATCHPAFALATGPVVYIVAESHKLTSLLLSIQAASWQRVSSSPTSSSRSLTA